MQTPRRVVVVDDGSTDGTAELMRRYDDPRIRFIQHGRNLGVCAAQNTGFDHIRGAWFTTLGSDDELLGDDALEILLSVPETIDPAINGTGIPWTRRLRSAGSRIRSSPLAKPPLASNSRCPSVSSDSASTFPVQIAMRSLSWKTSRIAPAWSSVCPRRSGTRLSFRKPLC